MAAAGGFLDIGDLVFGVQAGAHFGYSLMWALLLGLIVIIAYSEMSGRIVATTGKPVFVLVRERFGRRWGLAILVASQLVIWVTCAAEIGGVALVIQLLTGWPYHLLIVLVALVLIATTWLLQVDTNIRVRWPTTGNYYCGNFSDRPTLGCCGTRLRTASANG